MTRIRHTASGPVEGQSQSDKFKELARELEADENEARWDERLEKVARHKPPPETEKPE